MTLNLDEIEARAKRVGSYDLGASESLLIEDDIPNLIQAVRELVDVVKFNKEQWETVHGKGFENLCAWQEAEAVLEKWGLK